MEAGSDGTERDSGNVVTGFEQVGSLKVVLPRSLVQGFSKLAGAAGEEDRRDEPKGNVILKRIGDDRYPFYTLSDRSWQWVSAESPEKMLAPLPPMIRSSIRGQH